MLRICSKPWASVSLPLTFLNFPSVLAAATIANSKHRLNSLAVKKLLAQNG